MIIFHIKNGTSIPQVNKPFIFCYNDDDGYICVAGNDAQACISHKINHDLLNVATVKLGNDYFSGYEVEPDEYQLERAEGQGD